MYTDMWLGENFDYHSLTIDFLIESMCAGADVNAKNRFGCTLSISATINNDLRVAEHLLNRGADTELMNIADCSALMFASRFGLPQLAKLLLDHAANIDLTDHSGYTAIIWAESRHRETLTGSRCARGCNEFKRLDTHKTRNNKKNSFLS
jgi:ankyrin repeat protein